jgi:hypothetical protein
MVSLAAMPSHEQPWKFGNSPERRRSLDRRLGERRSGMAAVTPDRRRGKDRRRSLDRREGPEGHVRNALQMLSGIVSGELSEVEAQVALSGVIDRLWRAAGEIARLRRARLELGAMLRRQLTRRPPPDRESHD